MKRSVLYLILTLIILANSCKKNELPPPASSGSPVFYVKADVNGIPSAVSLQAGVNDYFMNSGHYQEPAGVYVYSAELKQNTCNNICGYGIKILIKDYTVSAMSQGMDTQKGLFTGNYEFNDGNILPLGYNASFNAEMSGADEYKWSINGTETKFNKSITHFFKVAGNNSVTLNVRSGADSTQHTRTFDVGNPFQANLSFKPIVQSMLLWGGTVTATSPVPVTNYFWDFGDGKTASSATSPSSEHTYSETGYFVTKLTMTAGSNTFATTYQVPAFFDPFQPHANFSGSFSEVPNTNALSTITLLLTDADGNVYSSADFDQPATSNFEIISVENYKNNDAGNPTKKIRIKFNCTVKHGTETINITNGDAVLAVSYKE